MQHLFPRFIRVGPRRLAGQKAVDALHKLERGLLTRIQSLFAIHLVAILFGATGIFGALILADAWMITWGRALFAVLTLVSLSRLFAAIGRQHHHDDVSWRLHWLAFVLSGGMLALHWVTFFHSVKLGGIAVATLGFASFPAFITLIEALFLREKVGWAEWLRLLLVSIGLVLITPSFKWADQGTEGLLWGILSGAAFGVLAVINRRKLSRVNAFQVAGIQNGLVFLLLLPLILPTLKTVSMRDWLLIAALGIVCTGLAHWLFVSSLRQLPARTAGLVVASEPLYAILFAWLLFSQVPTGRMLVGAAVMMAAIFSASFAVHQKNTELIS